MDEEKREQNRLAIATFIVASTIALFAYVDSEFDGQKIGNPVVAALLLMLYLAVILSVIFAFLYILAKAGELRYEPANSPMQKLLVKRKRFFYNAAVTVYIPVIRIVGALILLFVFAYLLTDEKAPEWAQITVIVSGWLWMVGHIVWLYVKAKKTKNHSVS